MNKPTSREVGFAKSLEVQNQNEEAKQNWDDLSPEMKLEKEKKREERRK